jgi:hypothetical protein
LALSAEDQLAISSVLARYCHLNDGGDPGRVASDVFAPDATLDYGLELTVGSEAIRRFFTAGGDRKHTTAHFVTTIAIEGDGDRATSTCHYQAWRWAPETAVFGALRPAETVSMGAYDDTWVRLEAGWRIQTRSLRILGPGPIGAGHPPASLAAMWTERARRATAS